MSSNLHPRLGTGVSPHEFRRVCAQFATGVAVATVLDSSGAPHGITVNSFTSVSLRPPLVLICIGERAAILPHLRLARHFGLNFLEEGQRNLSDRFARRGKNLFAGTVWEPGESGVPLLAGALGTAECRRTRITAAGDHEIVIGEVVRTSVRGGRPLVYFDGGYARLEP